MMRSVLTVALATISFAACGPGGRHTPGGDDTTDSNTGSNGSGDGCSDASKLVYVVDENNKLSQFDPTTKTFTDLGPLTCPAQSGGTPFSMGVDRNANAWVLYSTGELFSVTTTTPPTCTKSNWASQLGLQQFGMGFSTDDVGGSTDHLFIAGGSAVSMSSTSKLATLDTASMAAANVGTVTGWPELTGNANAELWGFFPDIDGFTTPRVEQINKANGQPVAGKTYSQPTLSGQATAWAFAFYGGDYWMFLMKGAETSTTVYQMNGSTGAITGHTLANGRVIVGAGVSTCAPVVIGHTRDPLGRIDNQLVPSTTN